MMETHRRAHITPQVVLGLLVIVIGVLFTLDNLHVIDAEDYLQYWPAILVAIGGLKLWQARDGHGVFGGLFLTIVGIWLLLDRLVVFRVALWDVWPLFFVFLGGYLVWRGIGGYRRTSAPDSRNELSAVAIMSGVVRSSNASAFERADLTAIMGGCEIDLRHATIAGDEAVVDVFALWGGIEIRVPEDWTIDVRVTPLMGGVEDKTRPGPPATGKRLVLRGLVIMAGIVVKP